MKPRYTKGQIVKSKAAVGVVQRGEMVEILTSVKATGQSFWYHIKTAAGQTAWLAESSLTPAVGGE